MLPGPWRPRCAPTIAVAAAAIVVGLAGTQAAAKPPQAPGKRSAVPAADAKAGHALHPMAGQALHLEAGQALQAQHPRIAASRLQSLTIAEDPVSGVLEATVDLAGVRQTLRLTSASRRSPDFRLLVEQPGGGLVPVVPPPCLALRGTVVGHDQAVAAGSLEQGSLRAIVALGSDDGVFVVEPTDGSDPRLHRTFRTTDVTPHGMPCLEMPSLAPEAGDLLALPTGGPIETVVCEIAVEADVQFFQKNGSSVAATLADIEAVIAGVDLVYERDLAIRYELTTVVIRTTAGDNPYTTNEPSSLLCQFRQTWNAEPLSLIRRDVAHLFTGRSLTGAIGVGYTGVICNAVTPVAGCPGTAVAAYSLGESRFSGATFDERIALAAHELGHNWSATHCSDGSCHIMCATIGGCGGVTGSQLLFGPDSVSVIDAYRSSRTCLEPASLPLTAPFFDDVPLGTLDTTRWSWTHGVSVTSAGLEEPSPPYSLELAPPSAEPYEFAEMRTGRIDLSSLETAVVRYAAQTIDVDAGERLFVEYFTNTGRWEPLDVVTSTGVDLPFFLPDTLTLPAAAHHAQFRLRFRVEADGTDDRWLIDDVYVGAPAAVCPEDLDGSGDVAFPDLLMVLSGWGPCSCPEDLDGDGEVGFPELLRVLSFWGPCP